MKCSKCKDGYLLLKSCSYLKRKNNVFTRHRKCDKCGFEVVTIEIDRNGPDRMRNVVVVLQVAIQQYVESRTATKEKVTIDEDETINDNEQSGSIRDKLQSAEYLSPNLEETIEIEPTVTKKKKVLKRKGF